MSHVSLPGLTVGVLRILCNGQCTAQRFHSEGDEHTCRVECPNERDSLPHCNKCPRLYDLLRSLWGQATVHPRRNQLLYDLITKVFLRSLQIGIVVMSFIDACVYAHHQHRRSIENLGNFGDCIEGRIRFMTAITPLPTPMRTRQHASQDTCCSPAQNFRLPKPQARYPHLPNARSTTRERG